MTRDAFVSYARQDGRETLRVCAGLEALGIRLWLDTVDVPRRATWREAVQAGIASSRAVLVVRTASWAGSPACRYELAVAVERCTPLVAMALPATPGPGPSLLPDGVELIDGGGAMRATIALVAARLARMREGIIEFR